MTDKSSLEKIPIKAEISADTLWVLQNMTDDVTQSIELIGKLVQLLALAHAELDGEYPNGQPIADQIEELGIPELHERAQVEFTDLL